MFMGVENPDSFVFVITWDSRRDALLREATAAGRLSRTLSAI
jgi:hypothetical protein